MTNETRTQIISAGIDNGLLIETCLGCGRPITAKGAKLSGLEECNDCPAGSGVVWNPKALEAIKSRNLASEGQPEMRSAMQTDAAPAVSSTGLFGDWVSCSQSLPPDQVPVLVVSEHGKKVVMYRERGVWVEGLTTAHWEPTHWTHLPPSPNDCFVRASR